MAKRGFSLVEVLVVLGIVGILAGLVAFVDVNNYRGDAFRAEVSALGGALQTARADALNNINQHAHGVAIHPGGYDGYVIYEGDSYATRDTTRDEFAKAGYGVSFSPSSPTEIVFTQLSGNASYDGDITLVDPNRGMTAAITINHEGRISW